MNTEGKDMGMNNEKVITLPMKVKEFNDNMISHNEIIALWFNDGREFERFYIGEAWATPEKYLDIPVLRVFGAVADDVLKSDTINLLVEITDDIKSLISVIQKKRHDNTDAIEGGKSEC